MNAEQIWFVYLLKCFDETIYCGITNNLEKRLKAHNDKKGAKYTRGRTPVILIRSFEVLGKSKALKIEHKIKSLTKEKKLSFTINDCEQF